jgi:hypothetical protein
LFVCFLQAFLVTSTRNSSRFVFGPLFQVNVDKSKTLFQFQSKATMNNVWVRTTAVPTWLRMRLPVPEGIEFDPISHSKYHVAVF